MYIYYRLKIFKDYIYKYSVFERSSNRDAFTCCHLRSLSPGKGHWKLSLHRFAGTQISARKIRVLLGGPSWICFCLKVVMTWRPTLHQPLLRFESCGWDGNLRYVFWNVWAILRHRDGRFSQQWPGDSRKATAVNPWLGIYLPTG